MDLDDYKLKHVFVSALGIDAEEFNNRLKLGDTAKWDSLSHFDLICEIESEFKIRFSTREIEQLQSVDAIREAIKKK